MARIRTIKPEFWQDEKLGPLDPIDRLVFLALISLADDAGRLVDSVRMLDGLMFPYTKHTCGKSLETLTRLSRILRYTTESGQSLVQITGWDAHQKVPHPSQYVLPPPSPENLVKASCESPVPIPDHGSGDSDHGSPTSCPPRESDNGTAFDRFWKAYPKKRSKGAAEKAWEKHKCDRIFDTVLVSLERVKRSRDWTKDGGQFIPHPASWLNAKGWKDEPTVEIQEDTIHLSDASRRSVEAAAAWVKRQEDEDEHEG